MAVKPFHVTPESFGPAEADPQTNVNIFTDASAPEPRRGSTPTITRKLEGDGANLVFMTFRPGQVLRSHTTAHPITVQTLHGKLTLETADGIVELPTGTIAHLRAMVVHEVAAPNDAADRNVLLLTMLTGERHSTGVEAS